ncbi:acetylxylan esterase [Gottfriedia acidiceleris]|uniref:acetylxylan esterase n=1 Tax=Gottfriedia acidiceleris TaxID=371036 RepID=UPI002F26708C
MNLFDLPLGKLQTYKPKQTKMAGFTAFWENKIAENKSYALNIEIKKRAYYVPGVHVYDVYFDGFRNSRIHGVFICPENEKPSAPASVIFHGYNWNTLQPHYALKYVAQGIPVLMVGVRGQNLKSPDHNHYRHGGATGWMTLGIENPDHYYYAYVYMDCFRSVDVVREISGKKSVFVEGGSQGGALAIAVAALQNDILLALSDVPFLTHFERSIRLSTEGPYNEIYHYFKVHDPLHKTNQLVYETLSYFDCMNLADWVVCPVLVGVGLEDRVCPPSSGYALYHHLGGIKEIMAYPEHEHSLHPVHEEEKLKFVAIHSV